MTKPNDELLETYRQMAKTSPDSMKAMIEANLKATCDKFAGHEDKLDDCIEYLTDCAREILGGKNGAVNNETCYRICRDYFNDEVWKEADAEKAKREAKAKKKAAEAAAKKKAAEEKKAAAEARKAEIARKKAEREAQKQAALLAKKKAEEEKKAELERKKAEAAKQAEEAKSPAMAPEPGQLDFFALMGV